MNDRDGESQRKSEKKRQRERERERERDSIHHDAALGDGRCTFFVCVCVNVCANE